MKRQARMTKEEFESKACFVKDNVEESEYIMHKIIYNSGIINVPEIYSYDKNNKTMVMQKLYNMNIADEYGEDASEVPPHMFTLMQDTIRKLYYSGIEYPNITGYNFIFYNKKMYLTNFKHCKIFVNKPIRKVEPFIKDFINGLCEWNPNYK
jgi:tRNA A-37 threonylcarbamoyl transferase component Bud32